MDEATPDQTDFDQAKARPTSPPSPGTTTSPAGRRGRGTKDLEPFTDADFGDFMARLRRGEIVATEPDTEPEPACPLCNGAGWVVKPRPSWDPKFGKAAPCECRVAAIAARNLERVFGRAEIPPELERLSFASFALLPDADQVARQFVEAYASSGRGWLYLHGDFGVGKTGLAFAAFRHRLEARGDDGLFRTSPDLLDDIRSTFDRDIGGATSSEVTDAVKTVPLLMLDDLGAENVTGWVEERLYMILNHRYLFGLDTIITSNLTTDALGRKIGGRTSWRIVERARGQIVHVRGVNRRAEARP